MNETIGIVVSVAALGIFIGLGEVSAQRDEGRDVRFVRHGSFSSPPSSHPQTHKVYYGTMRSELDEVGD